MERSIIKPDDFYVKPHHQWNSQWLVLGAGSVKADNCNVMTIGWGSFGTMWGKPVVQVMVRPQRHTFKLMEAYPEFSIMAFGDAHRQVLQQFGTLSGRDTDKIAKSGLELEACPTIDAPSFKEATLVMECRSLYHSSIDPAGFMDPELERNYPRKDYHHFWFGEILSIQGTPEFSQPPV